MPFAVQMTGSFQSDPTPTVDNSDFLSQSIDLAFKATYDACFAGNLPIAGTFVPALGGVTRVRAVCVRAVDQESLVVSITWAGGTAQRVPVSDLFLVRAQNSGDEITALSVTGTGRIEYLIGGDR